MSYHFAFSCCSWGSQGKNTEVVCHSLLQLGNIDSKIHIFPFFLHVIVYVSYCVCYCVNLCVIVLLCVCCCVIVCVVVYICYCVLVTVYVIVLLCVLCDCVCVVV